MVFLKSADLKRWGCVEWQDCLIKKFDRMCQIVLQNVLTYCWNVLSNFKLSNLCQFNK